MVHFVSGYVEKCHFGGFEHGPIRLGVQGLCQNVDQFLGHYDTLTFTWSCFFYHCMPGNVVHLVPLLVH